MRTSRLIPMLVAVALSAAGERLEGQIRFEDVVIGAGVTAEGYRGNFSAVTFPQIDSTNSALAGVGEWSASGTVVLLAREHQTLKVRFDGGLRQFATGGFQLRNYAPREYSGDLSVRHEQHLGGGSLVTDAMVKARSIADRPPMPLYLPPGYDTYGLSTLYRTRPLRTNIYIDVGVSGELADYAAPRVLPALDLLDRTSVTVTAGARRLVRDSSRPEDLSGFRLFGAFSYSSYPKQGLGGVLRTDHALSAGGNYELVTERLGLHVNLHATRSRSNSRRVEYNAGSIDATALWGLGAFTQVSLYGKLARKWYTNPVQDLLVPGEEADNASVLYAGLTRFLAKDVDMTFRFGWTKAETNISGAYYTRFGGSFFLSVRPWL